MTRTLNYFDPTFWTLHGLTYPFRRKELEAEQLAFLKQNSIKHRAVLWCTAILSLLTWHGLNSYRGEMSDVIAGLIAPVMVMGGAWFGISFGGIPGKLIDIAMYITFAMFTAFMSSLMAMTIAVCFISPPILWIVFGSITLMAYIACVLYDMADGLKAGLDEVVFEHAKLGARYYRGMVQPE